VGETRGVCVAGVDGDWDYVVGVVVGCDGAVGDGYGDGGLEGCEVDFVDVIGVSDMRKGGLDDYEWNIYY